MTCPSAICPRILHNKYRNKNETAFNPKNFKNLHFPTFKVLINTFILLLTIPGQFENRPNSVFCSLWAGWQSMKSSCNRCGFFETIWKFFKNWFFDNLLKSKRGWKCIKYFYKGESGSGIHCGSWCFSWWNDFLLTSVAGFILNFAIFWWFDAAQVTFAHFIFYFYHCFFSSSKESTSFYMVAWSHAEFWDGGKHRMLSFKSIWESCLRILRI